MTPANIPAKSCNDYCQKVFTSVVFNVGVNSYYDYKGSHKIILQQQPKESLTLDYEIHNNTPSYNYNQVRYDSCDLSLKFDNKLHEVSHDYCYEISLSALIWKNDHWQHHLPLFSHAEPRTTDKITLSYKQFNVSNLDGLFTKKGYNAPANASNLELQHLCCGIRRFNKSSISEVASVKNVELPLGDVLLHQHLFSDVCLKVGKQEFRAHREILAQRSSVFKAMFLHKETSESRTGLVKIDDIEAPVIEEMLHYMYTGRASANDGISLFPAKLLKAAHKYDLAELVTKCQEILIFELNSANVIESLELASLYELGELKMKTAAFISKHEAEMVKVPSYHQFLCRNMAISIDTLVSALKLCAKYGLPKVKKAALLFIKKHTKKVSSNNEYLSLFNTHPDLMKEIFVYINK